jgi:acetyltransferase-like isoleucine patch superfamily enzyme
MMMLKLIFQLILMIYLLQQMKKKLLILGAGQYGCVARETAEAMNCFEKVSFLDDNSPFAIGKLEDYECFVQEYGCAFVAIGNPQLRMLWLDKLKRAGFELPVLIHPRACVSPSAVLRAAVIVEPMAIVNSMVVVEAGSLLCAGCVVNHNAHIMPVCQIDCNAVVASNAVVPEGTKVHSGSVYERE